MEKKITKKDNFTTIANILDELGKAELRDVMLHEVELLDKKNSNKVKKANPEDEGLKAEVLNILIDGPKSITEMMKASVILADKSNQKITSIVKSLINSNEVVRTEVKGVAVFSLV